MPYNTPFGFRIGQPWRQDHEVRWTCAVYLQWGARHNGVEAFVADAKAETQADAAARAAVLGQVLTSYLNASFIDGAGLQGDARTLTLQLFGHDTKTPPGMDPRAVATAEIFSKMRELLVETPAVQPAPAPIASDTGLQPQSDARKLVQSRCSRCDHGFEAELRHTADSNYSSGDDAGTDERGVSPPVPSKPRKLSTRKSEVSRRTSKLH